MAAPRRLVDWPWVTVEVECSLCRRAGRYRLARLAEQHGAAAELGPLLRALAVRCGLNKPGVKPRQYEAQCGVRYRVPPGGPRPEGAPAREAEPGETWPPRVVRRGPEGPLPTIGSTRALGITALHLCCLGLKHGVTCWHTAEISLDVLGLPDDAVFVHIARLRRFRCVRCGSRKVQVMASWPDVRFKHQAQMGADMEVRMPGAVPDYRMPGLGEEPTRQ